MAQVRPRQDLPPPPPFPAEQGASHPIHSPCYTPHESEGARGVFWPVLRQEGRQLRAGIRLRFQQRPEERPRHRLAVQVCPEYSRLPSSCQESPKCEPWFPHH